MLIIVHHLIQIIKKKNFLILGEGPTNDSINDSIDATEKNLVLTLVKRKSCLILHYKGNESCLYVNKRETCKFKANDHIHWYNFCLESVSKFFTKDEHMNIYLIEYEFQTKQKI